MTDRLMTKDELSTILTKLMHPKKHGLTQEMASQALVDFCAACPDPVQARWLIVECLDPMTVSELIDRALKVPCRAISEVPKSVVPANHPSRVVKN